MSSHKILGLDLSSSTGWAVIENDRLTNYGLIQDELEESILGEDLTFFTRAQKLAKRIGEVVFKTNPTKIYIEQINLGRNRMSQKFLDFIHFAVLNEIGAGYRDIVSYVDTSRWRTELGIKLSKSQRDHNKKVSESKRKAKASGKTFRPGKGSGKIGWKHLSTNWANETYNLTLKPSTENDIADAIAVATFGVRIESGRGTIMVNAIKNATHFVMAGRR